MKSNCRFRFCQIFRMCLILVHKIRKHNKTKVFAVDSNKDVPKFSANCNIQNVHDSHLNFGRQSKLICMAGWISIYEFLCYKLYFLIFGS